MKFPNKEQRGFLFKFREDHGKLWKSVIRGVWRTGQDETMPILRQLRNDFGPAWLTKMDLDTIWIEQVQEVARNYVIAAIWADAPEGTHPRPTEATLREAFRQCETFIDDCGDLFEKAMATNDYGWNDGIRNPEAQFGHDYWLTRNGHGAGFLDRKELGDLALGLHALCMHKEASYEFANGWFHLYKDWRKEDAKPV